MQTDYTELIETLEALENAIRQTVLNEDRSQAARALETVQEIGGVQ